MFLDILLFLVLVHLCFGLISVGISMFVGIFAYVIVVVVVEWVEWFKVLVLLGGAWVGSPLGFLSGKNFHFWKIPPIRA